MIETKIFVAANFPAFVCAAPLKIPLDRFGVGGLEFYRGKGFWLSYGDLVSFAAIFGFWWWVGKQVDESGWKVTYPRLPTWRRRLYLLLTMLCLAFAVLGGLGFTSIAAKFGVGPDRDTGHLGDVTFIAWGLILGTYFVVLLRRRRDKAVQPASSRD